MSDVAKKPEAQPAAAAAEAPAAAAQAPAPEKEKKQKKGKAKGAVEQAAPVGKPAEFIDHRIRVWDAAKQRRAAEEAKRPEQKIVITLPDGKKVRCPGAAQRRGWAAAPSEC
jgi:threonyl-tRNA synthetase